MVIALEANPPVPYQSVFLRYHLSSPKRYRSHHCGHASAPCAPLVAVPVASEGTVAFGIRAVATGCRGQANKRLQRTGEQWSFVTQPPSQKLVVVLPPPLNLAVRPGVVSLLQAVGGGVVTCSALVNACPGPLAPWR
jgi:hypothetical protein